jgi:O-antigen ligase
MNRVTFFIMSLLVILIPPALISGPFLPDLFASMLGLIFIFISIKLRLFEYYNNKLTILFSIFYFYILFRSIFSQFPLLSLESSLFYFRFIFFAMLISYLIHINKKIFLTFLYYSLMTCFVLVSFDGMYEYFYEYSFFTGLPSPSNDYYQPFPTERIKGLFRDEWVIGSYCVRLLPVFIGLYILRINHYLKQNIIDHIFFYFTFLITVVIIIFSGERSALILLIILSFFIFLFLKFKNSYKFIIIISLVISSIVLTPSGLKDRYLEVTENLKVSNENVYYSMFITSKNMFLDNPLFGQGTKTYRAYSQIDSFKFNELSYKTHPHNTYIQLLAETGIVGTLFIVFLFLLIAFKIFSILSINKNYDNYFFYVAIFMTLWPLSQNGSFFNNWINVIYFIPLGLVYRDLSNSKN